MFQRVVLLTKVGLFGKEITVPSAQLFDFWLSKLVISNDGLGIASTGSCHSPVRATMAVVSNIVCFHVWQCLIPSPLVFLFFFFFFTFFFFWISIKRARAIYTKLDIWTGFTPSLIILFSAPFSIAGAVFNPAMVSAAEKRSAEW